MIYQSKDKFSLEYDIFYLHFLKDDQGSTVVHIAGDLNLPVAIALLMKQESSDIFNVRDRAGSSPIHRYTMLYTCTCVFI